MLRSTALFLMLVGLISAASVSPRLFLIGDSISIQYGSYLEKYLGASVAFDRKRDDGGSADERVPDGPNGGDSRMVLAYLEAKIKDPAFKPDVVLLNCGLHDIKKDANTGKHQVGIDEYEQNLTSIVRLLRKRDIKLIWIRTTQVVDSIHNSKENRTFFRYAADEQEYNKIADKVFEQGKVPVIDLYSFTKELADDRFIDHVHYNEETRNLQGAYIAGAVNALLTSKK